MVAAVHLSLLFGKCLLNFNKMRVQGAQEGAAAIVGKVAPIGDRRSLEFGLQNFRKACVSLVTILCPVREMALLTHGTQKKRLPCVKWPF